MRRLATLFLVVVTLATGCATAPPAPPQGQAFTGQVWGWDLQASTVTLQQPGGQLVHVRVTPDQLSGLRLHETVRVVGTPAPPADLVIQQPATPLHPVPRGASEQVEVTGTVSTVDPTGRLSLDTPRGPIHLWTAAGADTRFPKGATAHVVVTVQPVDMVPAPSSPAPDPAASLGQQREPGDYSVVTGRIIGVNPGGLLVVEAPTGPIQFWVPDPSRYRVGQFVTVRTVARVQS